VKNAFPLSRKEGPEMASKVVAKKNEAEVLAAELELLRTKLSDEMRNASRMREEYETQCRRLAHGDNANALGAKQGLDLATSRLEGVKAEIAEKERLLDEIQGREADENRRRDAEQKLDRAREELSLSQAELAKLRAEYLAMGEKIRLAEWRFQLALRGLHDPRR
jgi:hypothetical protein